LLGRDESPLKFLDESTRQELKNLPLMEHAPPMPYDMMELEPLQKEFFIKMQPHLPSPYFLTKDPLNRLITLSDDQLNNICRFLGLFDLYNEIKNVVRTDIFKSLKEVLSTKELQFLETCRTQNNPVRLPSMHIGAWDLKKESLDKALFDRGKTRLRGALSTAFETLFSFIPPIFMPPPKKPSKEITDILLKQLETVLNRAL